MVDRTLKTETLTPQQFKRIRHALDLSIPEVAKIMNLSTARTVRRWEDGEVPVSGPATLLMRAMLEIEGLRAYLFRLAAVRDREE